MSNFLAVATVTSAIQQILRESVTDRVPGAEVTTTRPDDLAKSHAQTGINIYLFHAAPNTTVRSDPFRSPGSEGVALQRTASALDLHYVVTCFGKEERYEPEKLLALATLAVLKTPELTNDRIARTIAGAAGAGLAGSDLASQHERVRLAIQPLSSDELLRLWSLFSPSPYRLSIVCIASVVTLTTGDTSTSLSPAKEARVLAGSSTPLRIREWEPKPLPGVKGSALTVFGEGFPPNVVVLINDVPIPTEHVDRGVVATLPEDLRVGAARACLATIRPDGTAVSASETMPLVIQPLIHHPARVVVDDLQTTIAVCAKPAPESDQTLQLVLSPTLTPARGQSSSDVLCFPLPLRLWGATGPVRDSLRRAFIQNGHPLPDDAAIVHLGAELRITSQNTPGPEFALRRNTNGMNAYFGLIADDPEGTVCFAFSPLAKGSYLLRLRVDGVETPMKTEGERATGPALEVG
jgi:hypothetical protein